MPFFEVTVHTCDCVLDQTFMLHAKDMIDVAIAAQDRVNALNGTLSARSIELHEPMKVTQIMQIPLESMDDTDQWVSSQIEKLKEEFQEEEE